MPTILVADDNSNIQRMVSLALEEHGIRVVAVGNGEAALRKLPDVRPDVVLADIFMPVRNGYEVCESVKNDKRFSHIPVILLVGAFDPLDEREARRVGADGVLKKPFVPPDPLIAMINAVLEKGKKAALAEQPPAEPIPAPKEVAAAPPPPPPPVVEEARPEAEEFAVGKGPWSQAGDEVNSFGEPVATLDSESDSEASREEPVSDWRRHREALEAYKFPSYDEETSERPVASAEQSSAPDAEEVAEPRAAYRAEEDQHSATETSPVEEHSSSAMDWMKMMSSAPAAEQPVVKQLGWEAPVSVEPERWESPSYEEPTSSKETAQEETQPVEDEAVASSEDSSSVATEPPEELMVAPAARLPYRAPEESSPLPPESQEETDGGAWFEPGQDASTLFGAVDRMESKPAFKQSPQEMTPAMEDSFAEVRGEIQKEEAGNPGRNEAEESVRGAEFDPIPSLRDESADLGEEAPVSAIQSLAPAEERHAAWEKGHAPFEDRSASILQPFPAVSEEDAVIAERVSSFAEQNSAAQEEQRSFEEESPAMPGQPVAAEEPDEPSAATDPAVIEAVVARVLERLQPQISDILRHEVLKPVVQSLLDREAKKK